MTQTNEDFLNRVVKKVVPTGKEIPDDMNHPDFAKRVIENAPNTVPAYFEYDANKAIKDFLFEQTDIAKQLRKMIEELEKKGYKDERKGV
jgi:hypothetical protein